MKRLLSFLIITGIVLFAAFKAGVWWLADHRMAEARSALSEYGVLYKGDIGSALDGRVTLKQAAWEDFQLARPLELGFVEFYAGSPVTLLEFLVSPERLPDTWRLTADQVRMQLEPSMFRNWIAADRGSEAENLPLLALACGPDTRQQPGSGDLLRMGITELTGDVYLEQTPGAVLAEINSGATGSVELRWPDARVNLREPGAMLESSTEPVTVTLRDAGLMRKLSAYCARETGLQPGQWAGGAVQALADGLYARELQASDQLRALYRQWLLEGGELTFTLQSDSGTLGIPVRDKSTEEPDSWQVSYNGARVPDVYLSRIDVSEPALPAEALEPVAPAEEPGVRKWYPENLEAADDWLGHRARVTLSNGNQVEGRLDRVGEQELELARMVSSGEVAYPIQVRAISTFEVWRRGRPD
ncbi:MAG: acetylornithine deacetylase [Pseudomonadota bacterium]